MQKQNTIFIGKVSMSFPELPSTNLFAIELLAKTQPEEGTLISTDKQTDGRGQYGRKWESLPAQNITLSIIVYPTFLRPDQQFLLNVFVALALKDTLEPILAQTVSIKWPNDIYVGEHKIAGILIQNSMTSRQIQSSVLGIGINVNQVEFAPHLPNPTSLALLTNTQHHLKELKATLCYHIEQRYLLLKQNQIGPLRRAYVDALLGYQQCRTFIDDEGDEFRGYIHGITQAGQLLIGPSPHLKLLKAFDLAEIKFKVDVEEGS